LADALFALAPFVLTAAVMYGLWRWLGPNRKGKAAPAAEPAKGEVLPPQGPIERLQAIGRILDVRSEETAHPRDLLGFPEFQEAVKLLEAAELSVVRQYVLGRIWTLACAALEALRKRPDRQEMLDATMAHLRSFSPGELHYVMRYLASLERRPPLGAPAAIAQEWWAGSVMLIESFLEHFSTRQAMGDEPGFGIALSSQGVEPDAVAGFLARIDHPFAATLRQQVETWSEARIDVASLSQFGRFWSEDAAEVLIEPEPWTEGLHEAVQALTGDRPRSILAVGGPRMGKSSVLRLLGQRLAARGWRVFEASTAELMADQMYFGQLEGRIRKVVAELDAKKKVVWCVGDLLRLARSGSHQGQASSVLDQIWPALASGQLLLLAESDPDGASRILQIRPSLRSLIEVLRLQPFDETELSRFAGDVAAAVGRLGGPSIEPAATEAALQYGQQYLHAADAPGVIADVLKRATDRAKSAEVKTVTATHVVEAVSQMTGLPADILDDDDPIELARVRQYFAERVIGQDEAISVVVDRIAMLKAGLVDPDKPIGVFLFAGPTGTGKTELAKTLADFLFGSPDRLTRLDMSEFQAPESVSKIVGERGASSGGDPLVERIRKQPFSVVLLDEFEKAHSNVWDLFLQVFDDGRLTDADGHTVDFRHTIIILTSNLGATSHRSSGMGFTKGKDAFADQQVLAAVAQAFRPEFVNRLDRIVVFQPLSRKVLNLILKKELDDVLHRRGLRSREWAVEWEPSALDFLLERGYSPELGARPLKRAIDQFLLAPLAATLVEHRFPEGDQFLFVRSSGSALEVEFLDPHGGDAGVAETEAPSPAPAGEGQSLAELVLKPVASPEARAFLISRQEQADVRLTSPEWTTLAANLSKAAADPEIWNRPERATVFSTLNLIDRVREAAETARRLARRLGSTRISEGSRELIERLALQLWLVEAGIEDGLGEAPPDAIVVVDAPMHEADPEAARRWAAELAGMYAGWAERRRMQFRLVGQPDGGPPILAVSGFGAWRTLQAEAGLHVLEVGAQADKRRITARVRVAEEPEGQNAPAGLAQLTKAIDAAPAKRQIVRRYRGGASPLIRDGATGLRSGQWDSVLGGDFDLVFAEEAS
jgi:ATP-dependent Clp protease ATP-binding subunit ClpC